MSEEKTPVREDTLSAREDALSAAPDDCSAREDALSAKQDDCSAREDALSAKQDDCSAKEAVCFADAETVPGSGGQPERFSVSLRELLAAVLMFPTAWLYVPSFWWPEPERIKWTTAAFLLLFLVITELLCRKRKRAGESWLWLLCLLACSAGFVFAREAVWDTSYSALFMHVFAVWYVLVRSDVLLEKESGRLLPADAINGFFVLPFSRFFLRLRTLFSGIGNLFSVKKPSEGKDRRRSIFWAIPAILLVFLLMKKVLGLLAASSEQYSLFTERLLQLLEFDWDAEKILQLVLSLPVGAYLFGLMSGAQRQEERGRIRCRYNIDCFLAKLRKVPETVWYVSIAVFLLLYLSYFAVEAHFYLSAFLGKVPEATIVSSYAREGFFELCRVLAINFLLLWLADRSGSRKLRETRAGRSLGTALLISGLLLAVSAFTRLLLYIRSFGFTPLRLEAAWLTVVLFFGCIAAGVTLLTGKKTFRLFLFFGGLSLSAMYLF